MATYRPPARIKSVRKHHMDLVEEHRILNGHYKRLMMAKSVIDTSTPRSFYTNPRKKRQLARAEKFSKRNETRSPSPFRPVSRSRSAGSLTKRESFRPSTGVSTYRNYSPPVKIVVSPSLDSSVQRSVSRLDLHRAASVRSDTRRANSLNNLQSSHLSVYKPKPPSTFQPDPGSRKRSLSKQYERRYVDGDIAEKHFHYFNQPNEPFKPRLLLFNVAESKIAQQPKNYQPPFWKLRLQHLRAVKLGLAADSSGHGRESPGHGDFLGSSFNADTDGELLSPMEKERPPSVSFRLGRGRMTPNTLGHLSPRLARELLFEKSYQINEQEEWRFMKEVTRDIISAQSCSERILFHIFSQAIKRYRNVLPVPRMRILLTRLMNDIQAPKEGILSVYVEHEPPVFPRTKDASTLTAKKDTDENDESKYDDDEYEEDEDEIIDSLADEDMENILQGKNLDNLYERLEESVRKKRNQKEKEKREKTKEKKKGKKKEEIIEEINEVSSIKSESRKQTSKSLSISGSSSQKQKSSEKDIKDDSQSNAKAVDSGSVKSDEETVGQVSDLEDDDLHEKINRILSNGSSKEKAEKNGKAKDSLSSSLSSGEFRLDAVPPKQLNSEESDVPSAREEKKSPKSPPSRELSLKSLNSDHGLSVSRESRKKWSSKREQSISKLDSPPVERSSLASISAAEEVRKKRESFLRKLEENEKQKSQDEDKLMASATSVGTLGDGGKEAETPQRKLSIGSVPGTPQRKISNGSGSDKSINGREETHDQIRKRSTPRSIPQSPLPQNGKGDTHPPMEPLKFDEETSEDKDSPFVERK